jgi:hypothetical protein
MSEEKKYKTFEYKYSESVFKKIEARWATYINEWGKPNFSSTG